MTDDSGWVPTATRLPRPNQRVDWLTPSGQRVEGGTFAGGLGWLLPRVTPMSVYYQPTHWRPAKGPS